jgi:hypothetical protein
MTVDVSYYLALFSQKKTFLCSIEYVLYEGAAESGAMLDSDKSQSPNDFSQWSMPKSWLLQFPTTL